MNELISIHGLLALLINSLFIFGVYNAGAYRLKAEIDTIPKRLKMSMVDDEYSGVLTPFRIWCENTFGQYLSKPIITCPRCMASVYSIPVFLFIIPGVPLYESITSWLVYVGTLSAINHLFLPYLVKE